MLRNWRNSIVKKTTLAVFAFGTLAIFMSALAQIFLLYQSEISSVEQNFRHIREQRLPGIISSLRAGDHADLQGRLDEIIRIPDVVYAKIDSDSKVVASAGQPVSRRLIKRTFPLYYTKDSEQISLGSLLVEVSLNNTYNYLKKTAIQELCLDAVSIFLITIFLMYIFTVILTRRLLAIEKHMSCLEKGKLGTRLDFPDRQLFRGNDELDHIASTINKMSLNLNTAFHDLETASAEWSATFDAMTDGVALIRADFTLMNVNKSLCEMFGKKREEIIGNKCYHIFHKADGSLFDCALKKSKGTKEKGYVETFEHSLGRWLSLSTSPILDESGELVQIVHSVRDITEQKIIEEKLRGREQFLNAIIDTEPDCVKLLDRDGSLLMMNRAGLAMIEADSFDMVKGAHVQDLVVPEYRDDFIRMTSNAFDGRTGSLIFEAIGLKGRHCWLESIAVPLRDEHDQIVAMLGITRDITDRKQEEEERHKLERQLLHAQKLESLGILAGGIAHDFNNILMAIVGNTDLALMRLSPESPAVDNLKRIEQSAARAADLAKQMLAYSGKGKFLVEPVDLNRLLEEILHMLEVSISKKSVLRFNLIKPLPAIEADATQMRQIIMNLVINASEAIGDKSGVISLTTGFCECDRDYFHDAFLDDDMQPGTYVFLEVSDTGCGMDRETITKVFDPFFTTKFTGRGLGMAAVLGIVRSHKGAIKLYSEPGKGSSFKVLLPACGTPTATSLQEKMEKDEWRGSGTVLLVDDEMTVRAIGSEMLEELGFKVITAANGRDALDIFSAAGTIDLVLLDLTMPGLDGEQTFRELLAIDPNVRVVMSSGFNEHDVTERVNTSGLAGFIQKPYNLAALRVLLRSLHLSRQ